MYVVYKNVIVVQILKVLYGIMHKCDALTMLHNIVVVEYNQQQLATHSVRSSLTLGAQTQRGLQ